MTKNMLINNSENWSAEENLLFSMCLQHIHGSNNIIDLSIGSIAEALGTNLDNDKQREYIMDVFKRLANSSEIHWTDPLNKDNWIDEPLIYGRRITANKVFIEFNPKLIQMLQVSGKSE